MRSDFGAQGSRILGAVDLAGAGLGVGLPEHPT